MNDGKIDWKGCLVATVTPFTDSGDLDRDAFRRNLLRLVDEGMDGAVVSGCTGEAWALSDEERLELFRIASETVGKEVPVIAGTGAIATRDVIELSRAAINAGAVGIMVLPPYYCMAGRRDVVAHYRAVSESVRHPILLYNIPRRVGFNLTPDVVEELAELEWVVAIKESSGDFGQLEATIERAGDSIEVFTGHSAARAVPALAMGARGYVSSVESQVMGSEGIELYALVRQGELERARQLQLRTMAIDHAIHSIGTFPANLKATMNLLGRDGGHPRAPILPLDEIEVSRVQSVIDRFGLTTTEDLPATSAPKR